MNCNLTCFNYLPVVNVLINSMNNSNLHRKSLILVENTEFHNLEFLGGNPDYFSKSLHRNNPR